jgi:hypothetical protein
LAIVSSQLNVIAILFPELFHDYKYFDVDDWKFTELVNSICDGDKVLNVSRLRTFEAIDRLHVCDAARRYIHQFYPSYKRPVLQLYKVKEAQVFTVWYEDKEEKRVAIRCPTVPRMYVYYKNLRVNEDFKVLIVDDDNARD